MKPTKKNGETRQTTTTVTKLDGKTLDCLLRFCKEEQNGTHSRMVSASWDEVIDKLIEWKENNCVAEENL